MCKSISELREDVIKAREAFFTSSPLELPGSICGFRVRYASLINATKAAIVAFEMSAEATKTVSDVISAYNKMRIYMSGNGLLFHTGVEPRRSRSRKSGKLTRLQRRKKRQTKGRVNRSRK